jgi:hypothetical protein
MAAMPPGVAERVFTSFDYGVTAPTHAAGTNLPSITDAITAPRQEHSPSHSPSNSSPSIQRNHSSLVMRNATVIIKATGERVF